MIEEVVVILKVVVDIVDRGTTVSNFKFNLDLHDQTVNTFGLRHKRLVDRYSTTSETLRSIRKTYNSSSQNNLTDLSQFVEGSQLDDFFRNPEADKINASRLSNSLYQTNLIYQRIINYLKDIYYWRYVTTPRKIDLTIKDNKKEFQATYARMLEIVDGLSIETTFSSILGNLLKNGEVFLYAQGDKTSKTVSTMLLPVRYCRSTLKTQYGTREIDFDFQFFDTLGLSETEMAEFISYFPKEFAEEYEIYKKDTTKRWVSLNPRFATCISLNDSGFPVFLSVFYDLIDYKTYKMNELDRNTNKLEKIVSQEIDLDKTHLELDEVKALHDSMTEEINNNKGCTLVTTVGKLNVLPLQENQDKESGTLNQAYNSVFSNAGLNYNLFNGSIAESLDASLKRDLSYMWSFVEQLSNFYNLALNNIYKFGNYQLSLKMLPISAYNEKDKLEFYRSNAEYGVGKLDFIVASGIRQIDLESTLTLEESLSLDTRLTPLQSSHTQSSTATQTATEKTPTKTVPVEDENPDKDSNIKQGDKNK
jgi:hypothetical protein